MLKLKFTCNPKSKNIDKNTKCWESTIKRDELLNSKCYKRGFSYAYSSNGTTVNL